MQLSIIASCQAVYSSFQQGGIERRLIFKYTTMVSAFVLKYFFHTKYFNDTIIIYLYYYDLFVCIFVYIYLFIIYLVTLNTFTSCYLDSYIFYCF